MSAAAGRGPIGDFCQGHLFLRPASTEQTQRSLKSPNDFAMADGAAGNDRNDPAVRVFDFASYMCNRVYFRATSHLFLFELFGPV
jgi:hypothetical protein